ncbi:CD109 antigen-like isoform X2 [Mya arenaria]|uniref:CD109 antigen-like isoform X2 n=1 Tax=Mya arenaria TaxID=6604 RepID=UPI0022E0FB8B|nr:CD109 antigen-like isoform X2 [Mya arenaria]
MCTMSEDRRGMQHMLLFFGSCMCSVIAENSFLFISSNTIRSGNALTIEGKLLAQPPSPVTVAALLEPAPELEFEIWRPRPMPMLQGMQEADPPTTAATTTTTSGPVEPLSSETVILSDTNSQTILLPIPETLQEGRYQLRIRGTGGLQFDNTTSLEYDAKSLSIFVQTNKAIYKPGQTVHFRVFGVTSELRVIFDDMNIELYDPAGNKINQWTVLEADLRTSGGVFESNMVMSDAPVIGDWRLKVKLRTESMEKTFTVDEYVLPKFEVSLDLPPFGRLGDRDFIGDVTAKYTYGKPVKGVADVRIRPKYPQFNWINNTRILVSKDIELQIPVDGTATFTVPTKRLRDSTRWLDYGYMVVEANVTETLTGIKLATMEQEVQFFEKPTKLEFPQSLPENFKPGLAYTAVLKVSERDDSPPSVINGPVSIKITYHRPIRTTTTTTTTTTSTTTPTPAEGSNLTMETPPPLPFIEPLIIPDRWGWWPRENEEKLPEKLLTIPPDGIVEIPLDIPNDVTRVSIVADYDNVDAYKSLRKSHSPSDTYLQLLMRTKNAETGGTADIEIRSMDPHQTVASYQVMSKRNIVQTGKVSLVATVWQLPLTADMAPNVKVIVYYIRPDGEVVADAVSFNVEGIFENEVTVDFDQTRVEPGAEVTLTVTADPGSRVNVLAVDKSVLLLKSGNDISENMVTTELRSYDTQGGGFRPCGWFCMRWPMPAGGQDVSQVFRNAGLVYITDANVYEHKESWNGPIAMPMAHGGFGGGAMMMRNDAAPMEAKAGPPPSPAEMKEPTRLRKLFPEMWLWETQEALANGSVSIKGTVPDTITSWVATAFAVHPETGLGLSKAAAILETFRSFFVSLQLPYSVVRGEKLILQANVFNYNSFPVFAYVLLRRNPDFDNIHISTWWTSVYSTNVARFAMVKPNSAATVYFPIIPRALGKIKLTVETRSIYSADAVERKLLVEPEGTAGEYNVPVLLNLKNTPDFTTTVPITFPPNTVPGSERITVSVIGDLMGPSINGLESLIKMPYGCGEQNMLNFAPNIFVTKYLSVTNNLDTALAEKTKNYMKKGYQRELTYQHKDGSFSAFGERDPSGSMWLSAFVLKSFVQARPYIFIDDRVMTRTVDWILKHQNSNGTFQEPGKVLHKEMQGGSIAGERSLTAFVLAALLEARGVQGVGGQNANSVALATAFLESEVPAMTDVYELAITSYALALAGSRQAVTTLNRLQGLATMEGGMRYWKKTETTVKPAAHQWDKPNGKALSVELSAYGLLALAAIGNRDDGLLVLKWLTSQRNPNGGFASTQDTIVALQALAEMASLVYSKTFSAVIFVTGPAGSDITENFAVNDGNSLILQSREVPSNIKELTISATGTGLSLVEVGVFYHVTQDDATPTFNLKIMMPEESINHYKVEVCTSYLKDGASSMAVIEIGFPSGFAADKSSINPHPLLKRVEGEDKKVILYLDEIGPNEVCFNALMERVGLVAGAQPVPVKVYDYYEPADHVTSFYVPEVLRNSDVCEVCGQECDFCTQRKRPMIPGTPGRG